VTEKDRAWASFASLVELMRVAQGEYFRTRDRKVLRTAKQYERKVDLVIHKLHAGEDIARVMKTTVERQKGLF